MCDSFPRNRRRVPPAGDEGLGKEASRPRQLVVRCGVRVPATEVNGEMRLPHGSDWSSIREAGGKPGTAGTRPAGSRERVTTGSASERPPTHR